MCYWNGLICYANIRGEDIWEGDAMETAFLNFTSQSWQVCFDNDQRHHSIKIMLHVTTIAENSHKKVKEREKCQRT